MLFETPTRKFIDYIRENEGVIVKTLSKSNHEKLFKRFYCIRWY